MKNKIGEHVRLSLLSKEGKFFRKDVTIFLYLVSFVKEKDKKWKGKYKKERYAQKNEDDEEKEKNQPPERFELSTPGLQDQCSNP